MHPAIGDAGLHLGAALATGSAPVPFAAAGYAAPATAEAWAGGWGSADSAPGPASGALLSGMAWLGSAAQGSGACAAMRGLLSKRTAAAACSMVDARASSQVGLPTYHVISLLHWYSICLLSCGGC